MLKATKRIISALVSLSLVFSMFGIMATAEETEGKTITILGTSDLHNRLYSYDYATDYLDADTGLVKISTLVKEQKALSDNVILMDCGDTIQDNSGELFNDMDVHPMIQAMNDIGYDVWTIGNHEFNFGLDLLNKNIAGFDGTVLSGNITETATGDYFVKPYEIFTVDGVRVAVVGMIPPRVPVWEASNPAHFEGLEFGEILDSTEKILKDIDGQYDVLVGAYHLGPDDDHDFVGTESVANAFPEFDVIFSAHAHSKYNEEVNGVKIIEPGRYGWALAKADITVTGTDGNYVVSTVETSQLETYEVEADAELEAAYAYVHEQSLEEANRVVGAITADFIAKPDFITGDDAITTIPTAQVKDTSVIDLINKVQMFYADADVSSAALFNFGSNLKAGDFKKKDVAFIYKYDNTLMGVNITGENLLSYMEWSASYYNTVSDGDLTLSFNPDIRGYNYDMFSGIDYKVDVTKEAGSRIMEPMVDGVALDPNKVYKLAVNNYRFGTLMSLGLVTADDKYFDSYATYQDAGRVRDLIIKYTVEESNGVIAPTVDNNWEVVGIDLDNPFMDEIAALIEAGTITIPTSEDGRTMNVAPLKLNDLIKAGHIKLDTYTIIAGDVLWKIAKKFGITYQELADMNDIDNPNMIYEGAMLYVPAN